MRVLPASTRPQRPTTALRVLATWAFAWGLLLDPGVAAAEEQWETVQTEPILIKTRKVEGSGVSEIWAEGPLNAPATDIQDVIMDADHFANFMPYVKESRTVGQPEPDGSQWVYTRLVFSSLVSSRDYVVKTRVEEKVTPDGKGQFRQSWKA